MASALAGGVGARQGAPLLFTKNRLARQPSIRKSAPHVTWGTGRNACATGRRERSVGCGGGVFFALVVYFVEEGFEFYFLLGGHEGANLFAALLADLFFL